MSRVVWAVVLAATITTGIWAGRKAAGALVDYLMRTDEPGCAW